MSRNLRTALIFGGFISLIGAAFYPIYFRPLMRLEEYMCDSWSRPVRSHLMRNTSHLKRAFSLFRGKCSEYAFYSFHLE
ncbi:small integral membrane protein 20 isoform X1 [Bos mutus]|uniref:small integral membrane protein 20 isoform X1 n=1 Tax=Bos javanicus TaxID=9906 RepID=UPI002AA75E3B|nr:small integral membrane protein 20 isoform X1 [Bos javanicus]